MQKIIRFFTGSGRQADPSTDFSQFVAGASSREKKRVVKKAVEQANADQLAKVLEAERR